MEENITTFLYRTLSEAMEEIEIADNCPQNNISDINESSPSQFSQSSTISSSNDNVVSSPPILPESPSNSDSTLYTATPISETEELSPHVTSSNSPEGTAAPKKKYGNCPPNANFLPPCRVCGEKASGLHYGANTCEPCKGFFRRSIVKMRKNEQYVCSKENNCRLGGGKRMMCSSCRYKKCLQVGMSHKEIKLGRYTHEKWTRDIEEVKKTKQVPSSSTVDNEPTMSDREVDDLVETLIQIEEEFNSDFRQAFTPDGLLEKQQTVYEQHKQKMELFGNLGSLPMSVYEEFLKITGIELDDRKDHMNMIASVMEEYIHNMAKFVRHIPGFEELLTTDKIALLKAAYHEYWFLEFHARINADLKVIVFGDRSPMGLIGNHQSMAEKLFDGKHLDHLFNLAGNIKQCRWTPEEVTIARGIVLTFTDRCILQEPEKVEKIQWTLIECLQNLLRRNYKKPNERLCQIFDKLIILRDVTHFGREIHDIKSKWPVMKEHPLVLEIIKPDDEV